MKIIDGKTYYTLAEAAEMLNLNAAHMARKYVANGQIKGCFKLGMFWWIPEEGLNKFISSLSEATPHVGKQESVVS